MFSRNPYNAKAEIFLIGLVRLLRKIMLDPVHFAVRNLLWAILQDNTEFVTAKTGKQVVFARGLLHGIDKMAEIAVSLTVAIVVVDVFQMSRVS